MIALSFCIRRTLIGFAFGVVFMATPAWAENWKTVLRDLPTTPPAMVVVDKSRQQLVYFKRQSPLQAQDKYVCTTGQKGGRKELQNDLRTPEGVYFVIDKIRMALDYMEYGNIAYELNYPNPVDRLDQRTGYGIWIHSRGRDITPMETRGCVAVNMSDIETLSPKLVAGLPVVIADAVLSDAASKSSQDVLTNQILEQKTKNWNKAWAARSQRFFDFYHPDSYTKAQGETFAAFQAQKKRLFAQLPWISINHGTVNILQGPDYWVSWFTQYYRAPNITSEGLRRLYWRPINGEFRIVGMEWIPGEYGMEAQYLSQVTPSVSQFVEQWRIAWQSANLDTYLASYASKATQGRIVGKDAIAQQKTTLWTQKKPIHVKLDGVRISVKATGIVVDMEQTYTDSTKYTDHGIKTLFLQPHGGTWRIVEETWHTKDS